jgi:hypothetical protein
MIHGEDPLLQAVLSLASCDLRPQAIRILGNLTALDLYQNSTGSRGLQALANAPHLCRLQELRLGWNGIGSAGLRGLGGITSGGFLDLSGFHGE